MPNVNPPWMNFLGGAPGGSANPDYANTLDTRYQDYQTRYGNPQWTPSDPANTTSPNYPNTTGGTDPWASSRANKPPGATFDPKDPYGGVKDPYLSPGGKDPFISQGKPPNPVQTLTPPYLLNGLVSNNGSQPNSFDSSKGPGGPMAMGTGQPQPNITNIYNSPKPSMGGSPVGNPGNVTKPSLPTMFNNGTNKGGGLTPVLGGGGTTGTNTTANFVNNQYSQAGAVRPQDTIQMFSRLDPRVQTQILQGMGMSPQQVQQMVTTVSRNQRTLGIDNPSIVNQWNSLFGNSTNMDQLAGHMFSNSVHPADADHNYRNYRAIGYTPGQGLTSNAAAGQVGEVNRRGFRQAQPYAAIIASVLGSFIGMPWLGTAVSAGQHAFKGGQGAPGGGGDSMGDGKPGGAPPGLAGILGGLRGDLKPQGGPGYGSGGPAPIGNDPVGGYGSGSGQMGDSSGGGGFGYQQPPGGSGSGFLPPPSAGGGGFKPPLGGLGSMLKGGQDGMSPIGPAGPTSGIPVGQPTGGPDYSNQPSASAYVSPMGNRGQKPIPGPGFVTNGPKGGVDDYGNPLPGGDTGDTNPQPPDGVDNPGGEFSTGGSTQPGGGITNYPYNPNDDTGVETTGQDGLTSGGTSGGANGGLPSWLQQMLGGGAGGLLNGGLSAYNNNSTIQQYERLINQFMDRGDYNQANRPGQVDRLNQFLMNPDQALQDQGYQDLRAHRQGDLSRQFAARGMSLSGNEMGELNRQGTEMDYSQIYNQENQLRQAAAQGNPDAMARAGMVSLPQLFQAITNRNGTNQSNIEQILGRILGGQGQGGQGLGAGGNGSGGLPSWLQQILRGGGGGNLPSGSEGGILTGDSGGGMGDGSAGYDDYGNPLPTSYDFTGGTNVSDEVMNYVGDFGDGSDAYDAFSWFFG